MALVDKIYVIIHYFYFFNNNIYNNISFYNINNILILRILSFSFLVESLNPNYYRSL